MQFEIPVKGTEIWLSKRENSVLFALQTGHALWYNTRRR